MDKFFATMDRDFDGRLTLEGFMGEETPIEKLFKLMDKNGDGFVTKKVVKRKCLGFIGFNYFILYIYLKVDIEGLTLIFSS